MRSPESGFELSEVPVAPALSHKRDVERGRPTWVGSSIGSGDRQTLAESEAPGAHLESAGSPGSEDDEAEFRGRLTTPAPPDPLNELREGTETLPAPAWLDADD